MAFSASPRHHNVGPYYSIPFNRFNDLTRLASQAMYRKILLALENGRADQSLVPHISELARQLGSELLLVHVADGWVARNYDRLKLVESEEMREDRHYLEKTAEKLRGDGLTVTFKLALGDPPSEILKTAREEKCDLIAMTTHGHRLIGDLLFGSTINEVRHKATIPVLLVRAQRK
jgi:nucleotide-binding universal stress UspA family protein